MSVRLAAATPAELEGLPLGYSLREMSADDIPAVHTLEEALFPADAWPLHLFEEELAHPEWRLYWVIEADGEIVAYAGAQYSSGMADVQTIAVTPAHEGRGLGGFLLRLMAARSRAWGATDLLLEVRVDNERAQGLYLRHGYSVIHTRRGYYNDGCDALIMNKSLLADTEPERNEGESA